jgi:hypothetical protein
MLLDGLMQIVICFDRALLAIVVRTNDGRSGKSKCASE